MNALYGAELGRMFVSIFADDSKFKQTIDTDLKKMESMGSKMRSIGMGITAAVTIPILGAAAASFKLASDYEESINKIDVAFKDSAQGVKDWSKNTLTQFGLAKGTALDMAAGYGDMATSMGLPVDAAANMSQSLVGLAGDLASFKNIKIDEANTALTAIFTGETESLKRLGIVMTQVNLEEYAASQGIKKKIKDMSQAEQVQLRYNYVMAKTANAQGDFARTGGGAANQMRIFGEAMKELGASMGENLLPIITPMITKLNELIKAFGALSPAAKKTIMIIAGIVAVVGPVIFILGTLAGAITSISTAFALMTGKTAIATAALRTVAPAAAAAEGGVASLGLAFLTAAGYIGVFAAAIYGAIEWAKRFAPELADLRAQLDPMASVGEQYVGSLSTEATAEIPNVQAPEDIKPTVWDARGLSNWLYGEKADGGWISRTGAYLVGEEGPEVVNLNKGDYVTPNDDYAAFLDYYGEYRPIHRRQKFIGEGEAEGAYKRGEGIFKGFEAWLREGLMNNEMMGFANGGIVPGPLGSPQLAVVHGGEEVLTPAQRQGAGGVMNHTGTIRVEGVNNANELVGIAEILADNISRNDRRLPSRVSLVPI